MKPSTLEVWNESGQVVMTDVANEGVVKTGVLKVGAVDCGVVNVWVVVTVVLSMCGL